MARKKTHKKQLSIPKQERSRVTYEIVIEAAIRVLETGGILAFSTNSIAEVAGVGVGSIYQYFRNKEHILEVVVQRHLAEIRSSIANHNSDGGDPGQQLDDLIDGVVEAHIAQPDLHRAISEISLLSKVYPSAVREEKQVMAEIERVICANVKSITGIDHDETINAAALIIHSMGESAIHRAVVDEAGIYSLETLKIELKRAVRAYLANLSGE